MNSILCKDCRHYRHDPKLNDNHGYCVHPAKQICERLYWRPEKPVEIIYPQVHAACMWCNDFVAGKDADNE